jgi:acetamidase/formamidase
MKRCHRSPLVAAVFTAAWLAGSHVAAQAPSAAGEWQFAQDIFGNRLYRRLTIAIDGTTVSGTIGRETISGTVAGATVHFTTRSDQSSDEFDATLSNDVLTGSVAHNEKDDPKPARFTWTARRAPTARSGPPVRHEFVPTTFHRVFSASIDPALRVWPGDTVHTTTVDAGGTDEKDVTRVLGGNPQTGPFFIETAMPGDILAVTLNRLRLNRDWAISDDAVVARAMDSGLAVKMKDGGKGVRWKIDRQRGVASPDATADKDGRLKSFTVPLRPMLGCIAVAPGFAQAPMPTGDSGPFGGNMDFNEIVEGTTVYLAVGQPGALLFIGDGHAAQGDGELNGNALETSMDVEFTVNVIRSKPLASPRVESPTHVMTVGLGGSLEEAMRRATSGMTQWLEQDYSLSPSEIAMVLGSSIEYTIGEVADRNVAVAAKLRKERLAQLKR